MIRRGLLEVSKGLLIRRRRDQLLLLVDEGDLARGGKDSEARATGLRGRFRLIVNLKPTAAEVASKN